MKREVGCANLGNEEEAAYAYNDAIRAAGLEGCKTFRVARAQVLEGSLCSRKKIWLLQMKSDGCSRVCICVFAELVTIESQAFT